MKKTDSLLSIINSLKTQGKMRFIEGATSKQIEDFERQNNIKLPIQYKNWLLFSDGGDLFLPAGVQLYGVAHKPIININEDDKPSDKYIVIGFLSTGDPVLCDKNGNEISIFNHEDRRIENDEKYIDFNTFLTNLFEILGIGG